MSRVSQREAKRLANVERLMRAGWDRERAESYYPTTVVRRTE